jgi:hypothetical protein
MDSLNLEKPCSPLKDDYSSILENHSLRQVTTLDLDTASVRDNGDSAESSINCVCQRLEEEAELLEIGSAASAGCQHCQILLDGILHFLPVLPEVPSYKLVDIFVQRREEIRYVKVICKDSPPVYLEFFITEGRISAALL